MPELIIDPIPAHTAKVKLVVSTLLMASASDGRHVSLSGEHQGVPVTDVTAKEVAAVWPLAELIVHRLEALHQHEMAVQQARLDNMLRGRPRMRAGGVVR